MTIFCPSCLHDWKEDDNKEKIKGNGIKCQYCGTFFVDIKFFENILKENNIKLDLRHIGNDFDD